MATQLGKACARSVFERKTSEKSKNKFKKIGHSLKGLPAFFLKYLLIDTSGKVLFQPFAFLPFHGVGCLRPAVRTTVLVMLSFSSQATERGRGSVCNQTSEDPITACDYTLQQVWRKKNKGEVQQSQHRHKVFHSIHKSTIKERYSLKGSALFEIEVGTLCNLM